ncbi:MAG: MATE family efflux transporter, partial [Sphingobium sp.]
MKSHQRAAWIAEIRALSALALPFVIGNLAWSLVAASNLFLLGRVSAEAMAAGSLATNLYNALQIFGMGIATAVSPMIARERGRRKFAVRDIRRTVRQGMWVTLAICLPVWALLWHAESILLALGQQAALSAQAASLLRGLQWALLPYLWFYVLRHYVGAMERPIWGVIITLIALPVNFLAGWTLILGNLGMPALGLFGAGLASSLTAVTMLVAIVIVISRDRQFRRFQLFGRFWVADWPRFGSLLRLGMPIAVLFAMEVTVFNAAAFLMGTIGQASLAAHAIANQAAALAFMIPLGISQAATIRAGLGFGRGDADAVRRSGRVA